MNNYELYALPSPGFKTPHVKRIIIKGDTSTPRPLVRSTNDNYNSTLNE